MINIPTVLILGAGASNPFGFPSGYELLKIIVSNTLRDWLIGHGYMPQEIDAFQTALKKSGRQSVDAFLEHRSEFLNIGKTAIALTLIPHENEAQLFERRKGPHWYDHLFNAMKTPFDGFTHNKLSVLTFNYDRSLEHYLLQSLLNAYGRNPEETERAVEAVEIVHLHGHLGTLNERPYSPEINTDYVRIAASGIKVIHENGMGTQPQFARAQTILAKANRVHVLGFGYDVTNVERLCVECIAPEVPIYGSALGLTPSERGKIQRLFKDRIVLGQDHWDCLTHLRNIPPLE